MENQVPFVRESCFDGETFLSLADAREHAERWCRDDAGARVHGTTRQVPREAFEADEKPHMRAPPTPPFDVPMWTTAKVQPDQHIQVAHALYCKPPATDVVVRSASWPHGLVRGVPLSRPQRASELPPSWLRSGPTSRA